MERYLYTVFSVHNANSIGVISNAAILAPRSVYLPEDEDRLTLKEIRSLEADFLEKCRADNPSIVRVILLSWQWLRSNEGFAP